MTANTATNTHDDQAMQALSNAGAQCGTCGDEPGARACPDCERCYQRYVAALRAAGWAPRAEVLNQAAETADRAGAAYAARGDNDRAEAAFALMEEYKKQEALNAEQGDNHVVDYDHDPSSDETPECVDDCPGCEADRTVAYRNPDRPSVLLCLEHGEGWQYLTPVTSDDLPDGGTCTWRVPACGRDVLAVADAYQKQPTP